LQILLFSGFLGSGKTTLILSVAKRVADLGRTSCIVVNEVGEIGIDGRVLGEGADLEVYEITAGCICCQIGVDLVRTLEEVTARFSPDLVIVEASGVATPGGVLDALSYFRTVPFRAHTVSLLDPTRLEALLDVMQPLIESQVTGADEIVVTKIDESTPDEIAFARAVASRLAPNTPVWRVNGLDRQSVDAYVDHLMEVDPLADDGTANP
jgi:G3E family GTPase